MPQEGLSARHRLVQVPSPAQRDIERGRSSLTVDLAVRIELDVGEGVELQQLQRVMSKELLRNL